MAVLALDIKHYLLNSCAPALEHLHCVAVSVADSWTGETIADLLQKVIAVTGTPAAYLKDGGTDLGKAVRLLNERGFSSQSIDDISHFIANLLKHEYENDPLFEIFIQACGQVSKRLKQTLLGCLAPPNKQTKARFMNVHLRFKWASKLLNLSPRGRAPKNSLLQKLRDSFDKLPECKTLIKRFMSDVEPLIACEKILKTKGMSQETYNECLPLIQTIPSNTIRTEFLQWMEKTILISISLDLKEVGMAVSSDGIETLFGVGKQHGTGMIKDANRIAQRLPSFCGPLTRQDAINVLNVKVKEQKEVVGSMPSLIRQRQQALSNQGCLDDIIRDDAQSNFELIAG